MAKAVKKLFEPSDRLNVRVAMMDWNVSDDDNDSNVDTGDTEKKQEDQPEEMGRGEAEMEDEGRFQSPSTRNCQTCGLC